MVLPSLTLRSPEDLEREIVERRAAEAALQQKTILLQLLHAVATTANQALAVDDALQAALDLISIHIGWPVGHIYLAGTNGQDGLVPTTFWHLKDPAHYDSFRRETLRRPLASGSGLPGRARAGGQPVWLANIDREPTFVRAEAARAVGLKTGFALPVLVGPEVVAVLEFFTPAVVTLDETFLIAMSHVGNQLGRVVERSRAREALEESEARFRSVAQSSHEAIVAADQQGTILFWNIGAERTFGYTEAEALGRPLTMLMPQRYHAPHRQALAQHLATGQSRLFGRSVEMTGLHKDGSEFPIELSLAEWRTGKGIFFSGIIRDITARKRAEESLKMSEAMFKGLFESAPDAIVVFNRDGRIFRMNTMAERIFGYRENELLGEDVEILLAERSRERHVQHRNSYLATEPRRRPIGGRLEVHGQRKDASEFPVDIMLGPLQTERHLLVLATVRDITERKQAEEALHRAHDELESRLRQRTAELAQANQALKVEMVRREQAHEQLKASLREKDMLLREVHHRVKNNLQVISSLLSIQSQRLKDTQAQAVFKESQNRVKSIAAIHQKLVRSSDLAHIDIADYVRSLASNLLRSYAIDPGAVRLSIDVADLQLGIDTAIPCALIINELITNSLKHAFPDGRSGEISIALHADGPDSYELTVHDDGDSFPRDFNIRDSESIGLQIVEALTEQLDGSLEVTTHAGTAFHIRFRELRYRERR